MVVKVRYLKSFLNFDGSLTCFTSGCLNHATKVKLSYINIFYYGELNNG